MLGLSWSGIVAGCTFGGRIGVRLVLFGFRCLTLTFRWLFREVMFVTFVLCQISLRFKNSGVKTVSVAEPALVKKYPLTPASLVQFTD